MLSNSSLQPWFDYGTAIRSPASGHTDPFAALPPIQPCYGGSIGGEAVNCSVVCGYTYLLFDPQHPSNLVTCGLWATVTAGLDSTGQSPVTTPFEAVGLNLSATETVRTIDGALGTYNAQLQNNLVACFASFYAATHSFTDDRRSTPNTCSATALFQYPLEAEPCFADLCSPRTLDADLGGIGVFVSLIVQSSLAIVTAIVLSLLVSWTFVNRHRQEKHTQAMMMATVDFQITQCYFAGAVQIAALVFTARGLFSIKWVASPELLDEGLLFTLATNGFVPTILTLALITQYGRQSWYLILLSSIVFVLSTGMLAASSNAWYATPFDPAYGVLQDCGDFVASNLTTAWCGSNNLFSNSGYNPTALNKIIWVMWAHSLLWLIYCVSKKLRTSSDRFLPGATKLASICQPRFAWSDRLPMSGLGNRLSQGLFAITWSLSLGYQLWLYAVILHGSITNFTWSFGQILAVLVWAPCLVEFINLEINGVFKGSRYRFPPPLALATTDSSGTLHLGNADSTSHMIPLANLDTRGTDTEDDDRSNTARREQHPAERI